jgi:hypothetical protein
MTHLIDLTTPATMAASVAITAFDRIFLGYQTSAWLAGIFAAVERREGPGTAGTISSRNVSVLR